MAETCLVCGNQISPEDEQCTYCGYRHRDRTMGFKPVSVTDIEQNHPNINLVTRTTLRVLRSPQPSRTIVLGDMPIKIGRNPKCDMFLNDMTVSRLHAIVSPERGKFIIEDNNSFNGVWVNGVNVNRHELYPGDLIQIGAFLIVFEQE